MTMITNWTIGKGDNLPRIVWILRCIYCKKQVPAGAPALSKCPHCHSGKNTKWFTRDIKEV